MEHGLDDANLGLPRPLVKIADSDPRWSTAYQRLLPSLRQTLGKHAVAIEHVGSTSVPGLAAKPILDIAVGLGPEPDIAALTAALESQGYLYRGKGEGSIGLLFVWESAPEHRLVHIHAIPYGGEQWRDYVDFREVLRAEPTLREEYASLKRALAERYRDDRHAYRNAKAEFISGVRARHTVIRPDQRAGG